MILAAEKIIRRFRRLVSRSELAIRLLDLPVTDDPPHRPGLVIIQIDGLSHTQLQEGLKAGRMPFLRDLLVREGYQLHEHYSGMPSSTPAVHAELFYGVPGAVPAFSYIEPDGRPARMYDREAVAPVEAELSRKGTPLLAGGSAYVGIFTGGAAESHFCVSSMGWGEVVRGKRLLLLPVLLLTYTYSMARVAVLTGIETLLAPVDCIRGLVQGRQLFKELKFVPTRVGINILLRELVAIGAKMDVARGLPVVHLNLLGYDEQAHRRGPTSRFAHWSLKGIDDTINRIWHAARRAHRRDYEVWIFSDHGQEEVVPYPKLHGRTIQQAVAEVFGEYVAPGPADAGIQTQRARLIGRSRLFRRTLDWLFADGEASDGADNAMRVVAMGPVGLVYPPEPVPREARGQLAKQLVAQADVPLVLYGDGPDTVAVTRDGAFHLPRDGARVLGADHPFLEEVTRDLAALVHSPRAGEFVLCGWDRNGQSVSFPMENGAHAGPGPEETRAFAMMPGDTPLPERDRHYLRPLDLRHAARTLLERPERHVPGEWAPERNSAGTVRIMTWNVHSCVGMDGRHSPERIARVIARHQPDVVALQELDVGRERTGGVDQAHRIAHQLEMQFHFHPAIHVEEEKYGDAVLTHLPLRLMKGSHLPGLPEKRGIERRGAVWVEIEVGGVRLQLINTHLGLFERERRMQTGALVGREWLGHPDCEGPAILCGDFNAPPFSPTYQILRRRLTDAANRVNGRRARSTIPGRFPMARIDHIFVDAGVEVVSVQVPDGHLERVASDHLPVIAEVRLPAAPDPDA